MTDFLGEDFLLHTPTAKKLFHEYAKDLPIIDYHCHLNPKLIAENYQFKDITELWLGGDHYKWRAMRSNGVAEKFSTGDASAFDKFQQWILTLQQCIGNPLYHWSALELLRYFRISTDFSSASIKSLWEETNKKLETPEFSTQNLINQSNVEVICTTDEPTDDLRYHKLIMEDSNIKTKVFPTFRPDNALNLRKPTFIKWIKKLESTEQGRLKTLSDLWDTLRKRMDYFHSLGCRLSDHALNPIPTYNRDDSQEKMANSAFQSILEGKSISSMEESAYRSRLLLFLGREYAKRDWVMQYHIGAYRNASLRQFELLGADSGFDCIDDQKIASPLISLLNGLDQTGELPRTILYSLNPRDTPVLGTIMGSFQDGSIPGKIQLGSAWWFNDHKLGMEQQLTTLANIGVLGRFIGMLTDSRSIISYPRHEYFRRILCNVIGSWSENGEVPSDLDYLGDIVQNICYYNAREYFRFP